MCKDKLSSHADIWQSARPFLRKRPERSTITAVARFVWPVGFHSHSTVAVDHQYIALFNHLDRTTDVWVYSVDVCCILLAYMKNRFADLYDYLSLATTFCVGLFHAHTHACRMDNGKAFVEGSGAGTGEEAENNNQLFRLWCAPGERCSLTGYDCGRVAVWCRAPLVARTIMVRWILCANGSDIFSHLLSSPISNQYDYYTRQISQHNIARALTCDRFLRTQVRRTMDRAAGRLRLLGSSALFAAGGSQETYQRSLAELRAQSHGLSSRQSKEAEHCPWSADRCRHTFPRRDRPSSTPVGYSLIIRAPRL